jgi:hypothetical protein
MAFLVLILTFVVHLNKSLDHLTFDKTTRDVERQRRYMSVLFRAGADTVQDSARKGSAGQEESIRGIDRVSFFNLLFCHWNLKPSHSWDVRLLVWRGRILRRSSPREPILYLERGGPC